MSGTTLSHRLPIAAAKTSVVKGVGAWGGGLIFDAFGSYDRAWQAAAIIGTIAGLAQIGFGAPRPGTGREALAPA
jgi:hypothetical protein